MGLLSSLAGIAAPIAGTIFGGPAGGAIGGAIGGLLGSSSQPKSSTTTTQQQMDPRFQSILFGDGTDANKGILSQYQALLNQPQNGQLQQFGSANQNYLGTYGASDLNSIHNAATGLMGGNQAPQVGAVGASIPSYVGGTNVNAPSQNSTDLSGTFNTLLGGGNTSALMNSLQAGNALTNQQLQQNQASLTDNLQKNVLPSIRGGAIAAGQYGSSRQGIAEGNALSDFTKQLTDSTTQIGLANSANNASQLANAYENGQSRALSAAQGLSAQQYATAFQNANTANNAELTNVNNQYDASKYNAGLTQQANLANQASNITTNQQNIGSASAGSGLLGGLLGQAYGVGTAQDNYGLTRAQGVSSLLAPYLSANQSTSTTQPLYQNTGSNVLGGALLGGQLSGLLGGGSGTSSLFGASGTSGLAGYSPATSMPNISLPNFGF